MILTPSRSETTETQEHLRPTPPVAAQRAGTEAKGPADRRSRYEVGSCYWQSPDGRDYFFRAPAVSDGAALWSLARDSGVLEVNSPYSYLLLSEHFADTCVVAERESAPVGFVSAFVSPAAADTVFVWQVGVAAAERGQGVACKLLLQLLARPKCRRVRRLEATVTPSNAASRALFESVARELGVPFSVYPGYGPELFPGSGHEREELIRIGPLPRALRGRIPRRPKSDAKKKHGQLEERS